MVPTKWLVRLTDALLQQDSPRAATLRRLSRIYKKNDLRLPVDLTFALEEAGVRPLGE